MKSKTIKTLTNASLSLVICSSIFSSAIASEENITGIYNSAFDDCFTEGYHLSELSQEQIYVTAECFSGLLNPEQSHDKPLGASKLTILQYLDSWYKAAAERDQKQGQLLLDTNRSSIAAYEQETHFGIATQDEPLFASENLFKSLDANNDGQLSELEVSSLPKLKQFFTQADFDNDGVLSVGEYAIQFGEFTAAGK